MIVYLWGLLLTIITVIYLFVCVDSNKPGLLSKIKNALFYTLPNLARNLASRICGQWFVSKVDGLATYLCYSQNPIVQFIYLICAVGGFAIYFIYGFCHLPGPFVAHYHKYSGTALMFACYYSYYKACSVDPGYITSSKKNQALKRFKFDHLLYAPKMNVELVNLKNQPEVSIAVCATCVSRNLTITVFG